MLDKIKEMLSRLKDSLAHSESSAEVNDLRVRSQFYVGESPFGNRPVGRVHHAYNQSADSSLRLRAVLENAVQEFLKEISFHVSPSFVLKIILINNRRDLFSCQAGNNSAKKKVEVRISYRSFF